MNKIVAMNNMIPHHKIGSQEKKPTYKIVDGKIINKQTGKPIGKFLHYGPPKVGERACNIRGALASYLPLAESRA